MKSRKRSHQQQSRRKPHSRAAMLCLKRRKKTVLQWYRKWRQLKNGWLTNCSVDRFASARNSTQDLKSFVIFVDDDENADRKRKSAQDLKRFKSIFHDVISINSRIKRCDNLNDQAMFYKHLQHSNWRHQPKRRCRRCCKGSVRICIINLKQ